MLVWAATGPIFVFSNTWQLVIDTGTTIITFLMVFVIQQSQNKDTIALHLKLNQLIASSSAANNRLVDIEDLNPEELATVKRFYVKLTPGPERRRHPQVPLARRGRRAPPAEARIVRAAPPGRCQNAAQVWVPWPWVSAAAGISTKRPLLDAA